VKKIVLILLLLAFAKAYAQPNVTLYWDASYGMRDRNLAAELYHLDSYFKETENVNIRLITFSTHIIQEENFAIRDSDWSTLQAELKNTIYDGASSFESVKFDTSSDSYILATDGTTIFEKLPLTAAKPITIINSLSSSQEKRLRLLAIDSGGTYVALSNSLIFNNREPFTIKGQVSGKDAVGISALPGVTVRIQGTNIFTTADKNGNFELPVTAGDILEFSLVGRATKRVRITSKAFMRVSLRTDGDGLDEVFLEKKRTAGEELVELGGLKVEQKRLGYSAPSITDEQVTFQDLDVKQVVKGQFANLEIRNNGSDAQVDLSQFLGRGKNMSINGDQTGLIVVDGFPIAKTVNGPAGVASTATLNPETIKSITYLKGLAATNRWGSLGRNGVLVIETIMSLDNNVDNRVPIKVGTTDTYEGDAEVIASLPDMPYINTIKVATSASQAYEIYLEQRDIYGNEPIFFIDMANYFKGWGNSEIVKRILSNTSEVIDTDIPSLRALAYEYEGLQLHYEASQVYAYILDKAPDQVQSYRDLALAFTHAGEIQKAAQLYKDIVNGVYQEQITLGGLTDALVKEYKSFVARFKDQINRIGIPNGYFEPEVIDRRIVVNWSDFRAAFDLQIINPEGRYFTVPHTIASGAQKLYREEQEGYGQEEFFLTHSDTGLWKFNLKNYGYTRGRSSAPVFAKFTIFTNFGTKRETSVVKVVRLTDLDKEYNVFNVTN